MTKFDKTLGFCKECDEVIREEDRLPEPYTNIFECPNCGYPHTINELSPVLQGYN